MTARKKSNSSPPSSASREDKVPTLRVASLGEDLGLTPDILLTLVAQARLEEDLKREAATAPSSTTKDQDRKDTDLAGTAPVHDEGPREPSTDRRRKPTKSLEETYRSAVSQLMFVQEELERISKASGPTQPSTPSAQQPPSSPSSSIPTRPSTSPAQDRTKIDS